MGKSQLAQVRVRPLDELALPPIRVRSGFAGWQPPQARGRESSGKRSAERLRGCADRSWSAGRSAFPTVAYPTFPDEPAHDDDHLREGYPEIDHPPPTLCTPHKLLMGVMPGTRPLHHPALRR